MTWAGRLVRHLMKQGLRRGVMGGSSAWTAAGGPFTRFGYLMRRAFFRLMLGDLNLILDGLTELEESGVQTIDCRRAQFSENEPILRLRMICQSWKVMFQAEYSSGQPLRMLVDLRASVEYALGRKAPEADAKAKPVAAKPAAAVKPAVAAKPVAAPAAKPAAAAKPTAAAKPAAATKPAAKAAAVGTGIPGAPKPGAKPAIAPIAKPKAKPAVANDDAPEFEVSGTPGWEPDSQPGKK